MKCVIYLNDGSQPWALQWAQAIANGLRAHGEDVERRQIHDLIDSDLAIIWGHGKPNVISHQRSIGKDYLVMERGYIGDRQKFTSLGFNGLNGRADFNNQNCKSDRWEKHMFHMKQWKKEGEYALIMGQVPGDQSIKHLDIREVLHGVADNINDIPVYYRPHPLAHETWTPAPVYHGTLQQCLDKAKYVITINSNSAVDAVINGVPAITLDKGSMAWDMSSHSLNESIIYPDREQWGYNLAYCQWTEEEIESGEAWGHLRHASRTTKK